MEEVRDPDVENPQVVGLPAEDATPGVVRVQSAPQHGGAGDARVARGTRRLQDGRDRVGSRLPYEGRTAQVHRDAGAQVEGVDPVRPVGRTDRGLIGRCRVERRLPRDRVVGVTIAHGAVVDGVDH